MAFSRLARVALGALGFASAASLGEAKERPVMKVVRMLQDMQKELQAELDDDQKVHELLTCWCKTNTQEKTASIAQGEARSAQLESDMDGAVAKMAELTAKRKATQEEQYADQKALDEAEEQRMKENKAFHAEETDLLEAIDASEYAITALSKHHTGLAQVRSVADRLRKARVVQILPTSGGLHRDQLEALKGFISKPEGSSFLSVPGFQSYAPQSGQIFGILKQLKKDFQDSLSDSQKDEAKSASQFEMLKAAKLEEIATAKKIIVDTDGKLAALKEKHAALLEEYEDVQYQLGLDREFLADLTKKCAVSGEEFAARTKSRQEEIAAVDDTVAILNSEEMFDVSEKTVNTPTVLLQMASAAAEREAQRMARGRAGDVLRNAAGRVALPTGDAPRLAMLAASAQLDAFTKVKMAIDKMVAELSEQNKEEIAHRDWCIADINENTRDTKKAYDKKAVLEAKIADLTKNIESLTKDIDSNTQAVVEIQKQMKSSSEIREAENADFQQTVTDQRLTSMILLKALDRMRQVYAFMQRQQQPGAAHIATSGTHTDAGNGPARFTKYDQNAGGQRVVAMLQKVIDDCKAMEDEAVRSEQDGQTGYEGFMKGSNAAITAHQTAITNMEGTRARAKEDLLLANGDFTQTMKELGDLNDVLNDLHKSCNYILDNFDARQAARTAEIEALREAKNILSGMN